MLNFVAEDQTNKYSQEHPVHPKAELNLELITVRLRIIKLELRHKYVDEISAAVHAFVGVSHYRTQEFSERFGKPFPVQEQLPDELVEWLLSVNSLGCLSLFNLMLHTGGSLQSKAEAGLGCPCS